MTALASVKASACGANKVDVAIAGLEGTGFWRNSTYMALVKLSSKLSDLGLSDEAVAEVLIESWNIVSNEYGE